MKTHTPIMDPKEPVISYYLWQDIFYQYTIFINNDCEDYANQICIQDQNSIYVVYVSWILIDFNTKPNSQRYFFSLFSSRNFFLSNSFSLFSSRISIFITLPQDLIYHCTWLLFILMPSQFHEMLDPYFSKSEPSLQSISFASPIFPTLPLPVPLSSILTSSHSPKYCVHYLISTFYLTQ